MSKVGSGCKLAIRGLDPVIPAGMTAVRVPTCVRIILAGKRIGDNQ